jgi:pimeloyl-ACP methyl ester carboxylesterase
MAQSPTIILVHGFWGGAAHWSKVIVELSRLGHSRLRAVELPLT